MSVQSAILIAPPIYSGQAWTQVRIFEQQTAGLVLIDTQSIALDATPATGDEYRVTTTLATLDSADYTFRFVTAAGAVSPPIGPVRLPSATSAGSISPAPSYVTVASMRARYSELTVAKYPDVAVQEAINLAAESFEHEADVAFSSRTRSVVVDSTSRTSLLVPIARVTGVIAASGSAGVIDVTKSRVIAGSYLSGTWPTGENVTVTVTHGYTVTPLRVIRAVMLLARTWLVRGPVDDRATQIPSAEGGTINLATPGLYGSWSGIPEVDGALDEYRHRVYAL